MAKLSPVASPFLVNQFIGSPVDPHQGLVPMIQVDVTSISAVRTDSWFGFQIPRSRSKTIGGVGKGTDGTNFDGVPGEFRTEIPEFKSRGLHARAPEPERELRVSRDLFGEADTPSALDASFQIEGYKFA
jgi:hypothetical protein